MHEQLAELDSKTEAICVQMAKKYSSGYSYLGYEFADVLQDARLLAIEAMSSYARQVSPSCSVYRAIYCHVNSRLMRYYLSKQRHGQQFTLMSDLGIQTDHAEPGCDSQTAFNQALVNTLCEQNGFIKLFYKNDCNQVQTAQALGITVQSVRSRLKTVHRHYTREKS